MGDTEDRLGELCLKHFGTGTSNFGLAMYRGAGK